MSKRRKMGERVWVIRGAGFGGSRGEWGKITEEPDMGCVMGCGDPNCNEYANVALERGGDLFHVSECQMHDEPK